MSTRRTPPSSFRRRSAAVAALTVLLGLAGLVASPAGAATVTPPGAPTITAVRPGDARLYVSVRAPSSDGGASVLGYVATATAGGASRSASSTSRTITITGLANGTTYSVTVKAYNSAGFGPASAARTGTPAAGPVALTATSDHPTFVHTGTRVAYAGQLTLSSQPVPNVQVTVTETYSDGKQVTLGSTTTDSNGAYRFTTTPLYNGTITIAALSAKAELASRVIVTLTNPKVTARHGRSITIVSSSSPGFITGTNRAERAQLQVVDTRGHVLKVLGTVNAAQRVSRHGYAHGVNDITFHVTLPHSGTYHLAVKVLGTPVNTGATSRSTAVRV